MAETTASITAATVAARNAEAITCEVDNELVVYTPHSHQGISLNSSAKRIWELCDGKRNIGQIVQEISGGLKFEGKEPADALQDDVIAAVGQLLKADLVAIVAG